jgi:putative endonuclease
MPKVIYVYIMASEARLLYVGVTNDLQRRLMEHRSKEIPGYTKEHDITRLVYYETIAGPLNAIGREKQIKSWTRAKRLTLIEQHNPGWRDLSSEWTSVQPS